MKYPTRNLNNTSYYIVGVKISAVGIMYLYVCKKILERINLTF